MRDPESGPIIVHPVRLPDVIVYLLTIPLYGSWIVEEERQMPANAGVRSYQIPVIFGCYLTTSLNWSGMAGFASAAATRLNLLRKFTLRVQESSPTTRRKARCGGD